MYFSRLIALALIWLTPVVGVYGQTTPVATASETTLDETGLWPGLYLKARFTEKVGYYAEHHWRMRNSINNVGSFVGRTRQSYNRAGINLFFGDYFEMVVGPALVLTFAPDKEDPTYERIVFEPRIWHQYILIQPEIWRIKVYHQFRFEHKWKRSNTVGSEHNFINRYRYKISAYLPLNNEHIKPGTFYFSPSAELFMQSGKSVVYNAFEDFRTYNGFGYVHNANFSVFLGHMWTLGQKSSGFEYRTSHIIRLALLVGLDFRPKDSTLPAINFGY